MFSLGGEINIVDEKYYFEFMCTLKGLCVRTVQLIVCSFSYLLAPTRYATYHKLEDNTT